MRPNRLVKPNRSKAVIRGERIPSGIAIIYMSRMTFRCLLFRHRPMLTSVVRREGGYSALCDYCGALIERGDHGRWTASEGLISRQDLAA